MANIQVTVPEQLKKDVRVYAAMNDCTFTAAVENLLKIGLKSENKNKKEL